MKVGIEDIGGSPQDSPTGLAVSVIKSPRIGQLVRLAQKGNKGAEEELFRLLFAELLRMSMRWLTGLSTEEREDIVLQAFEEALECIDKCTKPETFPGFVMGKMLNIRRKVLRVRYFSRKCFGLDNSMALALAAPTMFFPIYAEELAPLLKEAYRRSERQPAIRDLLLALKKAVPEVMATAGTYTQAEAACAIKSRVKELLDLERKLKGKEPIGPNYLSVNLPRLAAIVRQGQDTTYAVLDLDQRWEVTVDRLHVIALALTLVIF